MNTRNLTAILALIICVPLAIFIGISAAQDQVESVLWVGGAGFLIFCMLLGRHVWILIPATLGLQGSLNCLPGTPAPWHLMTAVTGAFFMLRWATRQQPLRFRWTGMETSILLVALSIVQAFARNPTGFATVGGAQAGGKPYVLFAVAIIAFVLISLADADLRSWRWAVLTFILFALADGVIAFFGDLSPKFATIMIQYYSNVNFQAVHNLDYISDIKDARLGSLAFLAAPLGLIASSFWRPLTALDPRKPWRGLIALSSVVLSLLGGSRGTIVYLAVTFSLGSILRRKPMDVVLIGIVGLVVLSGLLIAVPTMSLPYSIQRVLTILPGVPLRADIRQDAEGSNNIRFEMWELVLTTDRYITNKWLGDGFQISASELAAREALMFGDYRMAGGMRQQDQLLALGSYHGFHVETIRFTGVLGLMTATGALIVFAVFAGRCIRHFRNHPSWGYVLFICIPFLLNPLWYWLAFGSYRSGFTLAIATAGMIKLLYSIHLREQQAAGPLPS